MSDIIERLVDSPATWLSVKGPDSRVVHSTRVRLARNLDALPFPRHGVSDPGSIERLKSLARAAAADSLLLKSMNVIDFDGDGLSILDREFLVERHLVSREFAQGTGRLLILDDHETVSIMVNEEDHFRFQVLRGGLDAADAWRVLRSIERDTDLRLTYAFRPPYGYLTSCPTNLGTGLRVSALCHIPALVERREVNGVLEAATRIGIAVRGFYGEGSAPVGNFFQISNRTTLGHGEDEIVLQVESAVRKIAEHELRSRDALLRDDRVRMEDRFYRALSLLASARMMNSVEMMNLLSIVRLGIDMELASNPQLGLINEIQIGSQPAHLQKRLKPLEPRDRDVERARYIREKLSA